MALKHLFSTKTLTDGLKSNFPSYTRENLKYLVTECNSHENILCLTVSAEHDHFEEKFIMVRIPNYQDFHKKKMEYARSLKNIFTVEDDDKNGYLVFAEKGVLFPSKNNSEHLSTVLKSLAQLQAIYLTEPKSGTVRNCEYNVNRVSDGVISLDFFKDLDEDVSDIISTIQKSVDDLFRDGLVVKSVGSVLSNSVLLLASDKCVFLDLGDEVLRSPLYDALIFIFTLSGKDFRQHHLKTLLNLYYQTFIDLVNKFDKTVEANFDRNVFENHVKILLPIVKFETASYLIQEEKTNQEQSYLEQLLNNISYSLKYRQVSYEDCLEAISNKLGSTEFELINYRLVPLDEKNGHLGEYFSLKSTVKHAGKTEEFSMFVKLLQASNSILNAYTQPASKKEQFFFRTVIPLFKEYGLESLVDFAPNCYFDRLNDVVIQEDLAPLGYKPNSPQVKIGYEVLKVAFKQIAKLHACTLLLEDRMSQGKGTTVRLGDIYEDLLHDWVFDPIDGFPKLPLHPSYTKPGLDELIDSLLDETKDKEEFHKKVDVIFEVFADRMCYPAKQFRNVICHGDIYASNMLTRYGNESMADRCFLIDFQWVRYAPITTDILMLTYCNTTKDTRDKYLNILLEEYYNELKDIMLLFGTDINKFYTHEQFTECVKYIKPVGIITAFAYAQIIFMPQEKREEIFFDEEQFNYYLMENRKEFIKYLLTFSEDFVSYLKGLIDDLYDCV